MVPPDGGWGWVVVAASFMCNFVVDGIIFSGGSLLKPIQEEFNVSNFYLFYKHVIRRKAYRLGNLTCKLFVYYVAGIWWIARI